MSKRWFDLIASLICGALIVRAMNRILIMHGRVLDYNLEEFGHFLMFAIASFALRRFFYNKEK